MWLPVMVTDPPLPQLMPAAVVVVPLTSVFPEITFPSIVVELAIASQP